MKPTPDLDALARRLCESRRGSGSYDRKGCKRAHWLRLAGGLHREALEYFASLLTVREA